MTIKRSLSRRCSTGLLSLGVILAATGCTFDTSGLAPAGFRINCSADVWDCPKTSTPPSFTLSGANPNISKYIKRHNFWKVKSTPHQVYWNRPIFVHNPGPTELPGSTMVMTGVTEWNDHSATFMTVTLSEEVAGIYVAYDSRANPKPSWLLDPNRYQKLSKPVLITMTTNNGKDFVGLDVYLAKNVTAKGAKLALPGNSHGGVGWQQITKGAPAMYVVFVKPKPQPDCTKGKYKTTHHVDDCYVYWSDEEAQAIAAAKSATTTECQQWYPNDVCKAPVCKNAGWEIACEIDNTVYGCTFCRAIGGGFGHNSEVSFSSATSKASGTVADSSFNSTITGELLFDYKTDALGAMDVMRVNRMGLDVASFETELGEFSDIKVALKAPTAAKCQDWPAPVATPCHWYQIPAG